MSKVHTDCAYIFFLSFFPLFDSLFLCCQRFNKEFLLFTIFFGEEGGGTQTFAPPIYHLCSTFSNYTSFKLPTFTIHSYGGFLSDASPLFKLYLVSLIRLLVFRAYFLASKYFPVGNQTMNCILKRCVHWLQTLFSAR